MHLLLRHLPTALPVLFVMTRGGSLFSSSVFHCSWLMAGTNPPMPSLPAPSLQNRLPSARSQGGYKVKMKGGPVLHLSSLAWSSFAARMDPKHQRPLRSRLQPCSSPRALASQLQCIYLECHFYLSRLGTSSSSCIQSVWQRGKHKDFGPSTPDRKAETAEWKFHSQ